MDSKFFLFLRFFVILLFGLFDLFLFYEVFGFLTVNVFYFILNIFGNASLSGDLIFFNGNSIEVVKACVAGAAYYLLFALVMSTPMKVKIRIRVLTASLLTFFVLNVFRLVLLSFFIQEPYFELIHWIFWHIVSTFFVVGIWFGYAKLFSVRGIPFYDDFMVLKKLGKDSKRNKKHN